MSAAGTELTPAGLVDFGDQEFTPEKSSSFDPVRRFIMSLQWPSKTYEDRQFQVGGVERIALLTETPFMCYMHGFSEQHLGSAINGKRRCTMDVRQKCVVCEHYEAAPTVMEDGKKKKQAKARKRQQTFSMNILVYKTDLEGNLLDSMNQPITLDPEKGPILKSNGQPAQLVYEIYLWTFGPDKFQKFRDTKREWGNLKDRDFICRLDPNKPDSFQDFDITPASSSAWKALAKQDRAKAVEVIEYFKEHSYDVEALVGKVYDDAEMMTWIGHGTPQHQRRQAASEAPVADIAGEIEKELAQMQGGPDQAAPAAAAPPAEQPTPAPSPEVPPAAPAAPPITEDFNALLGDVAGA